MRRLKVRRSQVNHSPTTGFTLAGSPWVRLRSKSVGNVVNLVDLLERREPNVVRLALISTHYRGH